MLQMSDIDEVSVEPTTDHSLRAYSHSMLNTIATCPTKGLVTYVADKVMSNKGRALPLEAGSASHEAYAAARLWQLGIYQGLSAHMDHHGVRLFGEDKYEGMLHAMADAGDDRRLAMLRFCLEAFYQYGYYDDPADKRRTFTNIEEALIAYLQRFDLKRNVWVQDRSNPKAMVGIEIPLDVTITFKWTTREVVDQSYQLTDVPNELCIRFIGTADGLTVDTKGLRLEENKTASRLGEAWAMSWHTSHQQTGYMLALSTLLGEHIDRAAVHGMCIPLPRSYDAGGLMTETVTRVTAQFSDFLAWVLNLVQIIDVYGHDPLNAPKYTHSCRTYFRPCSLIPLCASDVEERQEYYDMMDTRQLTPTEQAMEDD